MEECIFCRICSGELPAAIVHEDEKAIIFLDRNQAARGHLLIVPREHATCWHELDEASAAHLGRLAARFAPPLLKAMGADGYNLLQNNGEAAEQVVMHVHLHLIPRWENDNYFGHGPKDRMADAEELRATASVIKAELNGAPGASSPGQGEAK